MHLLPSLDIVAVCKISPVGDLSHQAVELLVGGSVGGEEIQALPIYYLSYLLSGFILGVCLEAR